jgi:hypothetical protein
MSTVRSSPKTTVRVQQAVQPLHAAVIALVITSGRRRREVVMMLIEPSALATPIADFNGGGFVTLDMSMLEVHVLARKVARCTIGLILDYRMDAWLDSSDEWIVCHPQ